MTFGAHQHNAGRLGILGVSPEHVDGEGDFVGDALAGRLSFRPKFEVLKAIIVALAISVMNCFGGQKLAAKMFFHQKSVFKHFTALPRMAQERRDGDPDVSLFLAAAKFARFLKSSRRSLMPEFRPASGAAKFFLLINGSARAALNRHCFATLNACEKIVGVRFSFAADRRAWNGAVQRIFAERLSIGAKFSWLPGERGAANRAFKGDAFTIQSLSSDGVIASARAIPFIFAVIPSERKFITALQASFHNLSSNVFDRLYQPIDQMAIAEGNA